MRKLAKVTALIMCLVMLMGTCSALFINAYAVSAPAFTLSEVSKSGNTVTYELKLKSGSFNAIDFRFAATGATCTSIVLAPELGAGAANPQTGFVSAANPSGFSKAGGTVATATFTTSGDIYSVDVNVTNCIVVTEGTNNVNVTQGVTVSSDSESIFIKIIKAIINFFAMIIKFLSSLFSGAAA